MRKTWTGRENSWFSKQVGCRIFLGMRTNTSPWENNKYEHDEESLSTLKKIFFHISELQKCLTEDLRKSKEGPPAWKLSHIALNKIEKAKKGGGVWLGGPFSPKNTYIRNPKWVFFDIHTDFWGVQGSQKLGHMHSLKNWISRREASGRRILSKSYFIPTKVAQRKSKVRAF